MRRCSSTLTSDLRPRRSAVPDVRRRRSRSTWRDAGRSPPPRSLSTDPDKPSARPRVPAEPASLLPASSIRLPSSSPSLLIFRSPAGCGGDFRGQPDSWSRQYGTRSADHLSLRRQEQSARRRGL